ncbi:putative nuclease HARBI1 [Tanacetum coccineum]
MVVLGGGSGVRWCGVAMMMIWLYDDGDVVGVIRTMAIAIDKRSLSCTIDGTHVRASVREHEQAKYIGRKGYATQNIMAVWAGWEGTAHDTRIFLEALRRPQVNFSRPTGDKYYVVDAGYPNTKGYLAPYKGNDIRYHIPDIRRGQTSAQRAPKGKKETFNYYHASLRNVIERTFEV